MTKVSYLQLKNIPTSTTAFHRAKLVADNVVIEVDNTRRRINNNHWSVLRHLSKYTDY